MANSLQDQLLKAGLVNKKQVNQTNKAKAKKSKQARKHKTEDVDENKVAAQQAQQERADRDRALNAQREEVREQKALQAQIKQIIQHVKVPREEGDIAYNYVRDSKVKTLYVSPKQQEHLSRGLLAITAIDDELFFLPKKALEKILSRDEGWFHHLAESEVEVADEDDPYKDFVIPDDLMW
mgnify:CR=1 FL=1